MHEPPTDVEIDELLSVVQRSWDPAVEVPDHLAVGFGAHHWQACVDGEARYFVTLDGLTGRRTLQTLRAAYAGASALAQQGLNFVTAPIEPFVVPFADRAVSVTPWLDGTPTNVINRAATAAMLQRLHAVRGAGKPWVSRWTTFVVGPPATPSSAG